MCGSCNGIDACCPSAQLFQEKVCGNFSGPLGDSVVWSVGDVTDYVQGTVEIFLSSGTLAANSSIITQATGGEVLFP
ncbi:S-Ena type endospore appendage [Kroppenstedtia pulmonis]|uniref:S-Ena type endospore appendage n=1 Tax=Kroppenstedtia pulmonis TaxID=1380685 RepID=UPI0031B58423